MKVGFWMVGNRGGRRWNDDHVRKLEYHGGAVLSKRNGMLIKVQRHVQTWIHLHLRNQSPATVHLLAKPAHRALVKVLQKTEQV